MFGIPQNSDSTATPLLFDAPYSPWLGQEGLLRLPQSRERKSKQMLWTIFVILLVLWLVGLVSFHAIGAYIHILLVLAIIVLIIQLISGRRSV